MPRGVPNKTRMEPRAGKGAAVAPRRSCVQRTTPAAAPATARPLGWRSARKLAREVLGREKIPFEVVDGRLVI